MDPFEKTKKTNFSFPNVDQHIPGVFDSERLGEDSSNIQQIKPKKVVNIIEAMSGNSKAEEDAQTIRTYQGDIAGAIKNDNVSMIKIALAEKKRQDERRGMSVFEGDNSSSNNTKYLIIAGVFAFVVILSLIGGYIFLQSQSAKEEIAQKANIKVPQIIYTETDSELNIDNKDPNEIIRLIQQEKNGLMDLGAMKTIYMTSSNGTSTRDINSTEFFSSLNTRAPNALTRALGADFLFGVYAYTPREMFAVFKVKSYDAAFAGMLEWEPNMETDIGEVFINRSSTKDTTPQIETIESTSTPTDSLQIFTQKIFKDKVLSNKDTRVLQNPEGTSFMLYTFLDKDTLVLATSEKSLKEIIFRLTTGRIIR